MVNTELPRSAANATTERKEISADTASALNRAAIGRNATSADRDVKNIESLFTLYQSTPLKPGVSNSLQASTLAGHSGVGLFRVLPGDQLADRNGLHFKIESRDSSLYMLLTASGRLHGGATLPEAMNPISYRFDSHGKLTGISHYLDANHKPIFDQPSEAQADEVARRLRFAASVVSSPSTRLLPGITPAIGDTLDWKPGGKK